MFSVQCWHLLLQSKQTLRHRLSPSWIPSEGYGFGIRISHYILKSEELLPSDLKRPEQDKDHIMTYLACNKGLYLAGLKHILLVIGP